MKLLNTPDSVAWFDDRYYRIEYTPEGEDDSVVEFLPSVTTVLGATDKPWLRIATKNLGQDEIEKRLREGADAGSRIHHGCQAIMEGGISIYNPQYRPVYTYEQLTGMKESYGYKLHEFKSQEEWLKVWRFSEWVKLVRPVNFASEVVVWDMVNRVAGSLDYLWYIKGGEYKVNGAKPIEIKEGFYVVDLKTGKVLDDDASVQVSKYREMLNILLESGQLSFSHQGKTVNRVDGGIILHVNSSTRTGIQGVSTKVLENCNGDAHYFNNHLLPVWQRRNKDKQPKIFSMPTSIQLTDLIGE